MTQPSESAPTQGSAANPSWDRPWDIQRKPLDTHSGNSPDIDVQPNNLGLKEEGITPAVARDNIQNQEVLDRQQARELRDKYAERAYRLAVGALIFWAFVLAFSGWQAWHEGRPMWSDTVLIAITTGVTVSVLAAFLGVVRGIFGPSMK